MKNNVLVKTKIVLEDDGKSLVVYNWVKTFWVFGKWVSNCSFTNEKCVSEKKIKNITNEKVSDILCINLLKGF